MTKIYDPKAIPIEESCKPSDRRVFYVDVADMEPDYAKAFVETLFFAVKNRELKNGI